MGKDGRMLLKWIGCGCILLGSSYIGFSMAANCRKEERYLDSLIQLLDYMESKLQYHLTALPDLCKEVALRANGPLNKYFLSLSSELNDQISPNVEICANVAISEVRNIPEQTRESLIELGKVLGHFDVEGQVRGIEAVKSECSRKLDALRHNKDERLRSYQTLGICAGAGIAILLI